MKLRMHQFAVISAASLVSLVSCKNQGTDMASNTTVPGIVLENMDPSVNPKDDFYNYVNGSWSKNTKIPDDETRWGGFGVLRKSTRQDVLEIINASKELGTYKAGSDQKKALLVFESELDSISRNEAGISPLKPLLTAISEIKTLNDLQDVYAKTIGVDAPYFGMSAFADLNNSAVNAAYVGPGGLGLPDRDYYLDQDEKSKENRTSYVAYITKMLQYIGVSEADAAKKANRILEMETSLASPRLTKVERRDIRNLNNPMSVSALSTLTPSVNWEKFIKDSGVETRLDTIIITQPKYMAALNDFFKTTSIDDLKTLMTWSTLNGSAGYLTTTLEKERWEFYSKKLRGQMAMRPADERALGTVNNTVGEAIGQLYVEAKFPPEAKEKAKNMIAYVIEAFQARIEKLDWMSPETKLKAIEKLDKFTVKIAYPDEWKDYSDLEIKEGNSYAENMLAVSKWSMEENIAEIGQPVNKKEWGMSPQTVNAYFNPLNNEIVFPAAILQPPFYNYLADDAVNYGGIGAVIGHEISHAFDDSGARFDANGNVNNWWIDADLEEFEKRGKLLAEQYSAIEVLDSVHINGAFTLGENIGDLGGVLGAYDGLQLHFEKNGRPENIDGFTPEQRFFMSWATVWRTLIREDALRTQIKTDPHSPGTTRAIQPLKNVDAFYEAFDIQEGDGMYLKPEERVRIW